jgi:hypothetical protein
MFDNHKGEGRSRKSSRQRSVSDTAKPLSEEFVGIENKTVHTLPKQATAHPKGFGETARRGSMQKEPFKGTALELFHENETEEDLDRVSISQSQSTITESLTGSHRSGESGMGTLADADIDRDIKSNVIGEAAPLAEFNQGLQTEVSQDF